jgi:nucleoside-diphosphate-sugar epimerase
LVYVENLIDAILLAATTPAAHGQRFLLCDTVTTWRKFASDLLGPLADRVPELTVSELFALNAHPRKGFIALIKAIASSSEVRGVVKEFPLIGSLAQKWWRAGRRHPMDGPEPPPIPPAWLAELFGPTTTRFSSEAAHRTLGWHPQVSFTTAMAETVRWLQVIGLRKEGVDGRVASDLGNKGSGSLLLASTGGLT